MRLGIRAAKTLSGVRLMAERGLQHKPVVSGVCKCYTLFVDREYNT